MNGRSLALTLALAGCQLASPTEICNGVDDDGDGEVDDDAFDAVILYPDRDEDGFGAGSPTPGCPRPGWSWSPTDCDDEDNGVYPGAPERCDGRDQDCDGLPSPLEVDVDGDGWAPCQRDCDDDDPRTFLNADEDCDGLDQNCDGDVSDELDLDGDGFSACEGDCAPLDFTIYPGAVETCDGVDEDCDGVVDTALRVPGRFSSLEAAFAAARPGALVCVGEGEWVLEDAVPSVIVEGLHRDRTALRIPEQAALVTGVGSVLRRLAVRWDRPSERSAWATLSSTGVESVRFDLSGCTASKPCVTTTGLRTRGPTRWNDVHISGGVLVPHASAKLDLLDVDPFTVWTGGSISHLTIDQGRCEYGHVGGVSWSGQTESVVLHDLVLRPCSKPSAIVLGVAGRTTIRDITFDGDFSWSNIVLYGGRIEGMDLPTTYFENYVWGDDIEVHDVRVPPGGVLMGHRVRGARISSVTLGEGAYLYNADQDIEGDTWTDIVAPGPLVEAPRNLTNVTVRGGTVGGLANGGSVYGLDVRGTTFTGPVLTDARSLYQATFAGNTFNGPIQAYDGPHGGKHVTFVGNHFGVAPFSAPSATLSHVVFANNTGDGAISSTIPASYVHRHNDVTAAWSPLTATALTYGDPLFVDVSSPDPADWDLRPGPGSPLRDVGPSGCVDADRSPCDIGAGGR